MDVLNNPWVVGIVGGLLSGLAVTFISRYLFAKKGDREYLRKVDQVNQEVVYALRPGISEGHMPNEEVLDSLINSTARKYRVNRDDVFRPKQIAEELIKEIMDSSFISSETKTQYCELLAHLVSTQTPSADIDAIQLEVKAAESEYRSRVASRMSAVLGMTVAMFTMLTMFFQFFDKSPFGSPLSDIFKTFIPVFTAVVATSVAMVAVLAAKQLQSDKNAKLKRSQSKSSEDSER